MFVGYHLFALVCLPICSFDWDLILWIGIKENWDRCKSMVQRKQGSIPIVRFLIHGTLCTLIKTLHPVLCTASRRETDRKFDERALLLWCMPASLSLTWMFWTIHNILKFRAIRINESINATLFVFLYSEGKSKTFKNGHEKTNTQLVWRGRTSGELDDLCSGFQCMTIFYRGPEVASDWVIISLCWSLYQHLFSAR